jgi:cysteine-rich repeat protein
MLAATEECDDGNRTSGDGCSSDCRHEIIVGYQPEESVWTQARRATGSVNENVVPRPGSLSTQILPP